MATISTLAVNLIARTSVFTRNIKKSRKVLKRFSTSISTSVRTVKKFGSVLRKVTAPALSIISSGLRTATRLAKRTAVAFIAIGVASVKIASDVVETENLFKISMGAMAESAEKWTKQYSKSLNLFELDTKKSVGTFQLILTSMGLAEDKAYDMSKGLAKLVNDISSFRNIKPEEVFLKLQGGITGEIRPLRNIGILINDTTIKALALKDATIKNRLQTTKMVRVLDKFGRKIAGVTNSAGKQGLVLTEVEKVMLRYKAIVQATTKDQGDMMRTLDTAQNVFRQIWAQIKVTGNTIGKVLLPNVTKVSIAIRNWLVNNQKRIKKWATAVNSGIETVINKLKEYFKLAKAGKFEDIFRDLGSIFKRMVAGFKALFEKIKPIAIDLGGQIGKGFMAAVEGSTLGKIVGAPVEAVGRIKAPSLALGAWYKGAGVDSSQKRLQRLSLRAKDMPAGAERSELIAEMKKLNKAIQTIVQDNGRF